MTVVTSPDRAEAARPANDATHRGRAWLERDLDTTQPRVVIERVRPSIDGGRFAVKRVIGDEFVVQADVFTEGHDRLAVTLHYRVGGTTAWTSVPMTRLGEGLDTWTASFRLERLGHYEYRVEACVDAFASWREGLEKKVAAGLDVTSELLEGASLISATADRAGADREWLTRRARALLDSSDQSSRVTIAMEPELLARMTRHVDRSRAARSAPVLLVEVDRERARSGAWYEMFPRSASATPGKHGTFRDVIARLPYIASMGFDVLYLPPIHPIGTTHRKGKNNSRTAERGDVGSPWAIGAREGGHDAVHPALGTLADFDRLVEAAAQHGIEIALDIAWQCSPDHPWVREHPEWFRHRPDGSIQYAENPPKKYEDIYPLDFHGPAWASLWRELLRVVEFWIDHGVKIFRVDNPHTKPFAFWEWLIARVRASHPEVIFLSEAFTRPPVMKYLAKCGFTQSYTYFTWRNTKEELQAYLTEVSQSEMVEYFRPNLFANTPDILHEYLQAGGRPAHQIRFVLAATLASSYGIYGPPFELAVTEAIPGTEEYRASEKYQLQHWELDRSDSLAPFIGHVNSIVRDNPAFRYLERLRFLPIDNEHMLAYLRSTPDGSNALVVVVNLSPHHAHGGTVELPLDVLGVDEGQPFQVHDLLANTRYLWQGSRNDVTLDPREVPASIFRVRRRLRTERDFDYYA